MSNPNDSMDQSSNFVSWVAVLVLVGFGVCFAALYFLNERRQSSAAHQLRRMDEEAQKRGWSKDSNGTWSYPHSVATNASTAAQSSAMTNKPTSER